MSSAKIDFTSLEDFYSKIELYSAETSNDVSNALIRLNGKIFELFC